ncbi:hypothetical protein COV18_06810 [Candidatus Woesearchaeota archaeon CG10_big_fil_rev_8_21_14_0_10_37_12]|nr:MAG: hypothetical protein COV18_06810 [Candidatus Woesearchaeota archaeon CG10_big_fil_rev_8_21_14_0_10_37_12]
MKKGDGLSISVLSVIALVAAIAAVTLMVQQPTGNIAQGQPFYPLAEPGLVMCANMKPAFLLQDMGHYQVYCCSEDMIGDNACRNPHRIFPVR